MTERLSALKSQVNAVSPVEREAVIKSRALYAREWRKRKRLCGEILNTILEGGYQKSKKDLIEEVGIETDEELGVKLPDV